MPRFPRPAIAREFDEALLPSTLSPGVQVVREYTHQDYDVMLREVARAVVLGWELSALMRANAVERQAQLVRR